MAGILLQEQSIVFDTQWRAGGIAGPGSNSRHLISTSHFEVGEDTARARSIFLFYRETLTTPRVDVMGVWEDDLRRTEAGWKIARRTIVRAT